MFDFFRKLFKRRKKLERYSIDDSGLGRGIHVSVNLDHPEVKASIMYRLNNLAQYDIVNGKLVKKKNPTIAPMDNIDGRIYYHREMIKKYHEGYDVDVEEHRNMLEYYTGERE